MPVCTSTTRSSGRLAAAITKARRQKCGVAVVKDHDGTVHARPDPTIKEGVLQITVARDESRG